MHIVAFVRLTQHHGTELVAGNTRGQPRSHKKSRKNSRVDERETHQSTDQEARVSAHGKRKHKTDPGEYRQDFAQHAQ